MIHISFRRVDAVGISKHVCSGKCAEDGITEKQEFVWEHEMWYGSDSVCLRCGDSFTDGCMGTRSFEKGWRQKAIEGANKKADTYRRFPKKLTKAQWGILDWLAGLKSEPKLVRGVTFKVLQRYKLVQPPPCSYAPGCLTDLGTAFMRIRRVRLENDDEIRDMQASFPGRQTV